MRCEVGMGHSVKQEQPRAYPAFGRFFCRYSTFAVTDFQQSSCQFEEGEFDRWRYLLIFLARQALVRTASVLRKDSDLSVQEIWNISLRVRR